MLYPRKHSQSTELLTPRYRQAASNFVSAWIDNVPHERQTRHDSREDVREITKTRSFGLGSGKHGPQTGYPDMYFENDVFNNSRHRSTRESWEPDTRKSLSTPTTSDVAKIREKAEFPTRFRPAATLGANLSVISRADSRPDTSENFQRAKRGAVGPSHKACKPPSDPSKSTQEHKRSVTAAQNDPSDQDLICREREFFLKDRALFMRERESFLDEKQRFYSEKDVQLQLRGKSTIKKNVDTMASTPKSSDTVQTGCALSHTHPSPQFPSGSSEAAIYESTSHLNFSSALFFDALLFFSISHSFYLLLTPTPTHPSSNSLLNHPPYCSSPIFPACVSLSFLLFSPLPCAPPLSSLVLSFFLPSIFSSRPDSQENFKCPHAPPPPFRVRSHQGENILRNLRIKGIVAEVAELEENGIALSQSADSLPKVFESVEYKRWLKVRFLLRPQPPPPSFSRSRSFSFSFSVSLCFTVSLHRSPIPSFSLPIPQPSTRTFLPPPLPALSLPCSLPLNVGCSRHVLIFSILPLFVPPSQIPVVTAFHAALLRLILGNLLATCWCALSFCMCPTPGY